MYCIWHCAFFQVYFLPALFSLYHLLQKLCLLALLSWLAPSQWLSVGLGGYWQFLLPLHTRSGCTFYLYVPLLLWTVLYNLVNHLGCLELCLNDKAELCRHVAHSNGRSKLKLSGGLNFDMLLFFCPYTSAPCLVSIYQEAVVFWGFIEEQLGTAT